MWWRLLLLPAALAELPLPDYREELVRRADQRVTATLAAGQPEEALELARAFREELFPSASLLYDEALALRALGRAREAESRYRQAIELDPGNAAAWYDLGELLLARGELDQAEEAFQRAAELRPDHWAGPFRLAEVAGERGDAATFERELREALRRGFELSVVVGDPRWRAFYRDPVLGDVLRRLLTVYGDERLIEAFESQEDAR